jgi:putative SbcD/Mre11-related phosphoesterase
VCDGVKIFPGGAALIEDENTLVVADMHLGSEASLEYEGMSIPRIQTRKIEQYMKTMVAALRPSRVVVAGDLKHNFSRNLTQEWQDVHAFVKMLGGSVPLEVIKGNHDNFLDLILREFDVPLRREMVCGDIRIVHGHVGSLTDKMTIMGHIHPSIRLKDAVGASLKDHCFLYDGSRGVLILPALSLISPGTDVVSQGSSDNISPLLSVDGLSSFMPIMFSGGKALEFPTVGELRRLSKLK